MKFVMVLHGEVEQDPLAHAALGHDDPPLSDLGKRQAAAVATELQSDTGSLIVITSSPLRATRETASLIADELGVAAPHVREELATLTPEVLSEDGSLDALALIQERAWSVIEEAKTQLQPDATLVLITHELTIRALVCRALSMPLEEMRRFGLQPGSTSTIEWRLQPRERTLIASLNEVCHLEAAGLV
jgi:ribonuclease H / adenosylcobalamin/alpha-ribazole phosphatase